MAPLGARDAKLGLPLPRWHRDSAQHKCTQSGRSERPVPDSATVGVESPRRSIAALRGAQAPERRRSGKPTGDKRSSNRASRGARFAAAKQRSAGHRRASGGHTACVILRCVVPDESTASDAVQLLKLVSDAAGRRDLGAIHGALCARWSVGPLHTDWDGDIQGHAAIRGFMEDWFAVLTRSGSARPRSFSTSAMDRLRRVASERPSWWQQRRGPTSLRGRPAVRSGQDSASHELHGHR